MTLDAWVRAHPYLEPVARLHAIVESAASAVAPSGAPLPRWDDYSADFADGVPLLHSAAAGIDLGPVEEILRALAGRLAAEKLPERLADEMRLLEVEVRRGPLPILDCLMGDSAAPEQGLLRFLGWTAAARYLGPIVRAFEAWRPDERWMRSQCPTCGSAPAMAQLVGADPARVRFFACGHCATRWRCKRTVCPFCETDAPHLVVLAIEGEPRLRIDSCESCNGYLKTYLGEGDERLFLADWTSLHLDVMAADRGLERLAGSLYELPPSFRSAAD